MSADVLIPHPYRPTHDAWSVCGDCFALPTDPTFAEHHSESARRCSSSDCICGIGASERDDVVRMVRDPESWLD